MKKIYLAGMLLAATSAFAQVGVQPQPLNMDGEFSPVNTQNISRASRSAGDTVFYDGFEGTSNWVTTNGPTGATADNGWQISNTTGTNLGSWFFQNTRMTSTGGGNYAVLVPDDATATAPPTLVRSVITTGTAIDISGYTGTLAISYEKYGARYYDTLYLEVSNDMISWEELDNNVDFPILTAASNYILPNPTRTDLFIPSNVVNQDSLYIRFRWGASYVSTTPGVTTTGVSYGFFVDDVIVSEVEDNDLILDETAFFDDVRLLYSWYFGDMPVRQAAADTLTFSATYLNRGNFNATNTQLELVVSGQDSETLLSPMSDVNAGDLSDTARTPFYIMDQGQGTYTFTWNVISDSVDATPANNLKSIDLNVTDNVYSMAPLPVSSAGGTGKGGTDEQYVLTQDMYFMTTDTINAIGVAFDSDWSTAGALFTLSLVNRTTDVVVAETDYYTSTAEMIMDSVIYFPTLSPTEIVAGTYEVRFELLSNDSLYLVSCVDPESPIEPTGTGTFFSRTTLEYGGDNFISDMVYLTLKNNDNVVCDANADVSGTVEDQDTPGYVGAITINNVTDIEGPIYTYSWSGPNGFTSTDKDLVSLTEQGAYTVTVTDVNRCTAVKEFTVGGNVSVNDIEFDGSVSLFPNPNNGNFQLALEGVEAGMYTLNVKNVVGQSVFVKNINVASNHTEDVQISNLSKGIYFMEIENNAGEKSVVNFVVD